MEENLIIVHAFSMSASALLMVLAIVAGMLGYDIASRIASASIIPTVFGGLSGFILLMEYPLSVKCVLLSLYVAGAVLLYVYGFGLGDSTQARFIRRSANFQKR